MKRFVTAVLCVVSAGVLSAQVQTPTIDALINEINALRAEILRLTPAPTPPPVLCDDPTATNQGQPLPCLYPPPPTVYTTAAELDAAISAATPGDTLIVANTLAYASALTISKSLTIQAETLAEGRMDLVQTLPVFADGLTVAAAVDGVTLRGLEVRKVNHTVDILTVLGANVTLDRLRILGDPVQGAKRGIAAHANGNLQILRSYIADCFQGYPGNDSQAVLAWDMLPGLLIEDSYLEGGSETFMAGGADSTSPERDPKDITIRNSTITKKTGWMAQNVGVKNTLELKNARNVLIEDNIIEQSWHGHGQDGYLLAFTVRNQSGGNPTANVKDVVVRRNAFAHGAAAIVILGNDNNAVSETMTNVEIYENTFTDILPNVYSAIGGFGSKKLIQIGRGSNGLNIHHNTFSGTGSTSVIYFYGSTSGNVNAGMQFVSNTVMPTNYGIMGETGGAGSPTAANPPAWAAYVTGGTFAGNTVVQ